jgi:hypothetical protein
MFRFWIKHIHKSAHYDWYGNIDQEVKVCNWQKTGNRNVARKNTEENFLEMYRMNWKLHYLRCKDISTLLDGAMDDKVIRKNT